MRRGLVGALATTLVLAPATAAQRPPEGVGSAADVRVAGADTLGAADFGWELRTLEGRPVELAAYRGRVLFINLWATWCAPCVAELGSIERLMAELADSSVAFLLVSPEEPEPVRRFLRRHPYALPVLLEREEIPPAFGARALPTTWIVDRSGRIVVRHRGAARWDAEAVVALLRRLAR